MNCIRLISVLAALAVTTYAAAQRTIGSILPPQGFTRTEVSGFGAYLRNLPLKPDGSKVKLYDGSVKYWQKGAYAVVDMEIGTSEPMHICGCAPSTCGETRSIQISISTSPMALKLIMRSGPRDTASV